MHVLVLANDVYALFSFTMRQPEVFWFLTIIVIVLQSVLLIKCDDDRISTDIIDVEQTPTDTDQTVLDQQQQKSEQTETVQPQNNIQKLGKGKTITTSVINRDITLSSTDVNAGGGGSGGGSKSGTLEWLAQVYNPHHWKPNQLPGGKLLTGKCKSSMKMYLTALANGTIWAVYMSDASGRYADQFFFGNDFWLGSKNFCSFIKAPFQTKYHLVRFTLNMGTDYTPLLLRSTYTSKANQHLRLLSPEGHGISKCKFYLPLSWGRTSDYVCEC
ncbi:hypothetical protein O3M35_011834 [Rhynocoris fuscipes]|uniref:Nose resistant-to-fluoxetine protein N-terminal domain-containing protein n=1 Tax=Rhynocoris fuscipes TaxID=488301 RepID=A0AAW1CXN4_9HEMI